MFVVGSVCINFLCWGVCCWMCVGFGDGIALLLCMSEEIKYEVGGCILTVAK